MTISMSDPLTSPADLDLIIHSAHWDPFSIMGMHEIRVGGKPGQIIRAFLPEASRAWVIDLLEGEPGRRVPMERMHPDGFFQLLFPDRAERFSYRLAVENHEGHGWQFVDPYRFGPVLTD